MDPDVKQSKLNLLLDFLLKGPGFFSTSLHCSNNLKTKAFLFLFSAVLILDGKSKHVAQGGRKIGSFWRKIFRIVTDLNLIKCLTQIK